MCGAFDCAKVLCIGIDVCICGPSCICMFEFVGDTFVKIGGITCGGP